jgi:hypothetical protein
MRIIPNLPHGPVIPTHNAPCEAEIVPERKALWRCRVCGFDRYPVPLGNHSTFEDLVDDEGPAVLSRK